MINVKVKLLSETAKMPVFKTKGAACADLYANEERIIPAGRVAKVRTGVCLELPEGIQAKVLGRSGLSADGLLVQTGTIDSDYRGEISVIIFNSTNEAYYVPEDSRIAQLDICKAPLVNLEEVNELSVTERGSGGFGSTGAF